MLLLPNLPQLIIGFYGTLKAGGVAVFTLPTTDPEELIRQVKDCGARFLVTLTQFDELIYRIKTILEPSGASPLEHIIFAHISDTLPPLKRAAFRLSVERHRLHLLDIPMDASMHLFNHLLAAAADQAPDVPVSPGDLAAIVYTGGTTDRPQGRHALAPQPGGQRPANAALDAGGARGSRSASCACCPSPTATG